MNIDEKYSTISKILFSIGLFILTFIFTNVLVSSTLFIFKISITKVTFIISLIITTFVMLFFLKKENNNKKIYIYSLIISIIILFGTIFISGKIYDQSADGNSYHKSTIGMLANGWNPLYENMEDYSNSANLTINLKWNRYTWGNHYARASHTYAASIAIMTNNIETGKSINLMCIIMLFCFMASTLLYKTKKIIFSTLFSIATITCSTICCQFLTNYIDVLVYIFFFQLILIFFNFKYNNLFTNKNINYIVYFMTLSISINIKFSLFAYAGIFCLGYFIYYIIKLKKKELSKEFFIKFIITSIISLLIGLFVIGLSVYPKNYLKNGHPFYPLMGKDKIDIMTMNQPDYFNEKSAIEKFIISTFSESSNIMGRNTKAILKLPFSVNPKEINIISEYDLRIAGNGVLFSGILIISLIILTINMIKIYKKDKEIFYYILIPTVITLILPFFLEESFTFFMAGII